MKSWKNPIADVKHEFWYFLFIFIIAMLAYLISYANTYN